MGGPRRHRWTVAHVTDRPTGSQRCQAIGCVQAATEPFFEGPGIARPVKDQTRKRAGRTEIRSAEGSLWQKSVTFVTSMN